MNFCGPGFSSRPSKASRLIVTVAVGRTSSSVGLERAFSAGRGHSSYTSLSFMAVGHVSDSSAVSASLAKMPSGRSTFGGLVG